MLRERSWKGPSEPPARTRGIGSIKRERQLAAPGREETAEALRRGGCTPGMLASCVPQGRGVAPQACRPLAFRKGGKGPGKPPRGREASSCTSASVSSPLRGAERQPSTGPRIAPCGHAPRTCVSVLHKRGVSRRSKARFVQSGHGPRRDSPGTGPAFFQIGDPHDVLSR